MIYLSRLFLDPRSRQVQRELADPYEMHRTICHAFPNANFTKNEPSGILFRADLHPRTGIPTLLVHSQYQPDWSFLLANGKSYLLDEASLPLGVENPSWKEAVVQIREGQRLAFRLRANPTVKKGREGKEQGRRVGILREEDQYKWLQRKFEFAGAVLISANIANSQFLRGKLFVERENEKRMRFLSVQFDGVLTVREPDKLLAALESGIGSGKGLGFGLLSLAPVRG